MNKAVYIEAKTPSGYALVPADKVPEGTRTFLSLARLKRYQDMRAAKQAERKQAHREERRPLRKKRIRREETTQE